MRHYFSVTMSALLLVSNSVHAAECPPESALAEIGLCLTGIAVAGSQHIATFKKADAPVSYRAGDSIDGWLVATIDATKVRLERKTEKRELLLGASSGDAAANPATGASHKTEAHDVSPRNAGKAKSVGVSGKHDVFSISTHLPPVADY